MNKAYITLVVDGSSCSEVLEALEDAHVGKFVVLAQGDISESTKDLGSLQNEVWVYQEPGTNKPLALVLDERSSEGRPLTEEEFDVLRTYGVCTGLKIVDPGWVHKGPPHGITHTEAAQVEVCNMGFNVVPSKNFHVVIPEVPFSEDRLEQRWLRIAVPAWLKLTA